MGRLPHCYIFLIGKDGQCGTRTIWELENSDWSPSDLQDLLGLHEWNESVGLDQCFLTFFIMETPFKQQQKIETAPSPSTVHVTVAVTVIVSMNSVVPLEAFVFHSWKFCTYDKNTFTGKPFVSGVCLVCVWNYRPLAHIHGFLTDLDWVRSTDLGLFISDLYYL